MRNRSIPESGGLRETSGPLLVLLMLFFICTSGALALDPQRALTQYVHDLWTSDQGLPQNSVNAVIQTSDGYLWLATLEGLARFDGARFVVFDHKNTPAIPSNRVNTLLAASDGTMWIGTDEGVARFQNGRFANFSADNKLLTHSITTITEGNSGEIWIGTDSGLSVWRENVFTNYSTQDGLVDSTITGLALGKDGSVWIGSRKGLNVYTNQRFSAMFINHPILSKPIRALYGDSHGAVWIGSEEGLFRYAESKLTQFTTADGLSNNNILSLLEDSDQNLWIGTKNGGLNRYANRRFTSYTTDHGLSSNFVAALMEDKEGSLWIGSWGGGLDRLRDGKFVMFGKNEGLGYDSVASFAETRDGGLWIGTYAGGLSRWKDGTFTQYTTQHGLSNNVVCSLFEDSSGVLWVGTSQGLDRFRNGRFQAFPLKKGIVSDVIYSILQDREGSIWTGTRDGGLKRYRNDTFVGFTQKEGLPDEAVYTILRSRDDALWVGTKTGLYRFADENFSHFSTKDGLSHNFVTALYEDSHGALWIGTSGGGLNRYKNRKFAAITTDDGLFDDVVYSIIEDDQGYYWMTSNKGIFRIAMKDLNDFANGSSKSISGTTYGKLDGMRGSECNSGQHVSLKTRDGKLWFATLKGAAVVDPGRMTVNTIPPPVVIERVTIDDRSFDTENKRLVLGPGKVKFEFQYTALSFVAPERVLFKYKLEGLDSDWVSAGTRRVAYYSNLNRGRYRFRVIACNNDGMWNSTGSSIAFELKPFFYQTTWFYVLCAIVAFLGALAVHRFRLRRVRARFLTILAERTRIARDLHDTLAQSLSAMISQIDAADELFQSDSSKSRQYLQRVRSLARQGLQETRQAVWKLRPEREQSIDFEDALRDLSHRFSVENNVNVEVHVEGPAVKIPEPVAENLLRIAHQAITNAIQHASATRVEVLTRFQPHSLFLSVRDEGPGFDLSARINDGQHFGLKGMQERAAQIAGKLDILSTNGEGTRVTVQVPF